MGNRDIVAIGTSAGGVEALLFLVARLPRGLPAAILVTLHLPSEFRSSLDLLLSRAGPLPAHFASHGERVQTGRIYIAPPARHLLLDGDRISLGAGPRENNARPAIDPMLRSVAVCCGSRSIGVVLTGTLGDGAAGLSALKQCGGIAVVQDPSDAVYSEMPTAALRRSNVDRVALLSEMPVLLQSLVAKPAGASVPAPEAFKLEVEIARNGPSDMYALDRIGRRSVLTCPDCHGTMWELNEDELVRYRCHLGHAYGSEPMALALDESVRRALASGLRALEERITLVQGIAERATKRGQMGPAKSWGEKVREFEREAETVRDAIRRIDTIARAAPEEETAAS